MYLKIFATLPLAIHAVSAANTWTAFLYTNIQCGQSGSLVATVEGLSGVTFNTDDYTASDVRSLQMQWNSPNPAQDSGVTGLFSTGDNGGDLFVVGGAFGNACITAARDFHIDGWKSEDCVKAECSGTPEP